MKTSYCRMIVFRFHKLLWYREPPCPWTPGASQLVTSMIASSSPRSVVQTDFRYPVPLESDVRKKDYPRSRLKQPLSGLHCFQSHSTVISRRRPCIASALVENCNSHVAERLAEAFFPRLDHARQLEQPSQAFVHQPVESGPRLARPAPSREQRPKNPQSQERKPSTFSYCKSQAETTRDAVAQLSFPCTVRQASRTWATPGSTCAVATQLSSNGTERANSSASQSARSLC